MKFGLITDGYGVAISGTGGGAAPAIDGYHVHVYACNETTGAIQLTDTGISPAVLPTISGSVEGTAFVYDSRRIGRSHSSLRLLADTTAHGFETTSAAVATADGVSLEFVALMTSPPVNSTVIVSLMQGNNGLFVGPIGNSWRCIYHQNVTDYAITSEPIRYGVEQHVLLTLTSAGVFTVYVDGTLVSSTVTGAAPTDATYNALTIGNFSASHIWAWRGWVRQVRISNAVRNAAYALTTSETVFAM